MTSPLTGKRKAVLLETFPGRSSALSSGKSGRDRGNPRRRGSSPLSSDPEQPNAEWLWGMRRVSGSALTVGWATGSLLNGLDQSERSRLPDPLYAYHCSLSRRRGLSSSGEATLRASRHFPPLPPLSFPAESHRSRLPETTAGVSQGVSERDASLGQSFGGLVPGMSLPGAFRLPLFRNGPAVVPFRNEVPLGMGCGAPNHWRVHQ